MHWFAPGINSFWLSNRRPNGSRKLYQHCRIYPVKIYSDSSSIACAAFIENKHQMVCHQMFSVTESLQSSNYRELLCCGIVWSDFETSRGSDLFRFAKCFDDLRQRQQQGIFA